MLNSHIVTHRSGNILTSQEDIHKIIRAERYIQICADPKVIAQQREKDTSRARIEETVTEIENHQYWELQVAKRLANDTGAEIIEIWNTNDMANVDKNVVLIEEQIKKLMRLYD